MELPETIRERIKLEHPLVHNCINILIQDIQDAWEDILTNEIGFIDVDIKSDVSFSQGSGTSFTFSGIDGEKLENYLCYCNNKYEQLFFTFTKCLDSLISVYTRENNFRNHYVHEKTVYIDWNLNSSSISIKLADNIDWFIENYIEPLRLRICSQIQNDLEEVVLHSYTDEYVTELFEDCNIRFTANGIEV
jgi:hypothetical protein